MFCKCLAWFEALNGRLIGPKTWDRIVEFFGEFLEPIWTVCDCVGAVWGVCFIIYEINCVLVCMRPEMAMDFGFTKWNRCWMIGREQ